MISDIILSRLKKLATLVAESHVLTGYELLKRADGGIEIVVDGRHYNELKQICEAHEIVYRDGLDSIIIDTHDITNEYKLLLGIKEVKRYCYANFNTKKKSSIRKLIVIGEDGSYLISEDNAYVGSSPAFINDVQYIFLFYRFAERMRKIANYFDEATNTYVLFTSNKGVVQIALGEVDLTKVIEHSVLHERILRFEEETGNKRKLDFIKGAMIERVEHSEERNLTAIISRLHDIIEDSIRNHQLYMEEYTFDKFKKQWNKDKESYFNKIRDVLQKVLAMTANLPIALIAFVISSNEEITEHSIEVVFLGTFLAYVVVAVWAQILNIKDVKQLDNELMNDAQRIEEKCSETSKLVKADFYTMRSRARSILLLSYFIIISFTLISIVTLCFLFKGIFTGNEVHMPSQEGVQLGILW